MKLPIIFCFLSRVVSVEPPCVVTLETPPYIYVLCRLTTTTILIFSLKKYMTAEAKKQDHKKYRSGFCSIVWSELEIKRSRSIKVW